MKLFGINRYAFYTKSFIGTPCYGLNYSKPVMNQLVQIPLQYLQRKLKNTRSGAVLIWSWGFERPAPQYRHRTGRSFNLFEANPIA